MMNTSKTSYKEYSFATHKEVYILLEQVFKEFGIHYYLIGANARDIYMYKAGVKPSRGTADIDFAVMLPDFDVHDRLYTVLKLRGFKEAYGNEPYRLYYEKSKTVIDLLPYGTIAQNNTVSFTERNLELSVIGFEEVGTETELFEHPEGISIPVSSAHGIVLLKLISWSEKHERTKDLTDIKALLDIAWNLYENEFFSKNSPHADLFDVENFDMYLSAARVMGRKMQTILNQNSKLKSTIIYEIESELKSDAGNKSLQMAKDGRKTVEEIQAIFNALWFGINDSLNG